MGKDTDFEIKIKKYLVENLVIDVRESGGDYGSKKYIAIQLKIGEEVISEVWIES